MHPDYYHEHECSQWLQAGKFDRYDALGNQIATNLTPEPQDLKEWIGALRRLLSHERKRRRQKEEQS